MASNGLAPDSKEPSRVSAANVDELLADIDTVLLDCDGVIWTVVGSIPNAIDGVKSLRNAGKKTFFVTNNNLSLPCQIVKKFQDRGYDVKEDEVAFPVLALVQHLKDIGFNKKILYFGVKSPKTILKEAGFQVVEPMIHPIEESIPALYNSCQIDPDIEAIVVDVDVNLTYAGLTYAANILINNPKCQMYTAATDKIVPLTKDFRIMGPGFFADMLQTFTGRKMQTVGKPNAMMIKKLLQKRHNFKLERSLFIGDSLLQDISMAASLGMRTLLVLTGITPDGGWRSKPPEQVPDYVIDSVADFVHLIPQSTILQSSFRNYSAAVQESCP